METVIPTSRSTCRAKRASTTAGGAPCRASVPARSITASSIDRGNTRGVSSFINARTARDALVYFSKSGRITTASGQAFRRLEHRHCALHAVHPRDVTRGGDDTAHAAANDDRDVTPTPAGRAFPRWHRTHRNRHERWSGETTRDAKRPARDGNRDRTALRQAGSSNNPGTAHSLPGRASHVSLAATARRHRARLRNRRAWPERSAFRSRR